MMQYFFDDLRKAGINITIYIFDRTISGLPVISYRTDSEAHVRIDAPAFIIKDILHCIHHIPPFKI